MDGKGPYRIYDPGGSEAQSKKEASSYRQLLEENTVLRERMKGLKSLGEYLGGRDTTSTPTPHCPLCPPSLFITQLRPLLHSDWSGRSLPFL